MLELITIGLVGWFLYYAGQFGLLELFGKTTEGLVTSTYESEQGSPSQGLAMRGGMMLYILSVIRFNNNYIAHYRFQDQDNIKQFGKSRISGHLYFHEIKPQHPAKIRYLPKYPSINSLEAAISLRYNEVLLYCAILAAWIGMIVYNHYETSQAVQGTLKSLPTYQDE